jgi:hypothetical protein
MPKLISFSAALCLLASAGQASAKERPNPGRPQLAPARASSVFEPALRCMDDLLSRSSSGAGYYLVAENLDDPSQKMGVTRDLIIAAATRMSQRSKLFKIVTNLQVVPDGATFFRTGGSITAYDENVETKDKGGSLTVGQAFGVGARKRASNSNLTVSLFLYNANLEVVDGTFHSAQLLLQSKGSSRLLSGALGLLGGSLELDMSSTDGPQSGAKALIDLAMIEAVGSLAEVPYANCLALTAVDPANTGESWDAFRRMKPAARTAAIVAEMVRRGLAPPNPSREQLRQAISAFERSQGLAPVGIVRFEVYHALRQAGAKSAPMNRPTIGSAAVKVTPSGSGFHYDQASEHPSTAVGQKLAFEVTVAEPAYVACYYTDADRQVKRVFPNRERPAYRLAAGETLRIPGDQDRFVLKPARSGQGEWFTCLASRENFLPRIAATVPEVGFQPIPGIASALALVQAARKADPSLSTDTLSFWVR